MPQLLLEFFSEEIPARMQPRAEADLERMLMDRLSNAGFLPEGVKAFSTPRRIMAVVEGLPARQPDVKEERKGPRVGAPEKAIEGFLRGAGLSSIDQARVQTDPKGDFYVADIEKVGRETPDVIAEIVPDIVKNFPWPKSMRSGTSDLYWVRPLQSILCAFDGETVPLEIVGVPFGRSTQGHHFHAPGRFEVRRFDDYREALFAHRVVLEREERKRIIAADAKTQCQARGLELVEDPGLLDEVAGLVEWPVVIVGDMDRAFLELPAEVIRLTMRTHQRYFAVRDPKSGALAPHFVTVANVEAKDGGAAIAAGNARVLSARLNDARFFWELDKRKGLEDPERLAKLDQIVFHQKLGSVGDKVRRIEALAVELAGIVGADPEAVRRAAQLCKADLVTETVGEFPELQGQIGRQLYEAAWDPLLTSPLKGEEAPAADSNTPPPARGRLGGGRSPQHQSIAVAIEDHYRPLGPSDRVPTDPVAICVALADKLDSLAGFWSIDEKPTGSSDPFALRRAALGVVRVLSENNVRLALEEAFSDALSGHWHKAWSDAVQGRPDHDLSDPDGAGVDDHAALLGPLLAFLADRLKVQLREQGKRHDLVDAVFALGDDDLVRIVARVEALEAFLKTEDGKNLLAGYKRAANILAAEEKKGKGLTEADATEGIQADLLKEPQEKALYDALQKSIDDAKTAMETEDFAAAMTALAQLRGPVDAFFDKVLVNSDDAALRRNRLLLLSRIRENLHAVAEFSKIEG